MKIADLSETQIHALIQKAYQDGAKGNGGPSKDLADVTCYNCNEKGHYANKCPKKDTTKEIHWKKKKPTEGEAEIKTVNDVIWYWCKHCKRWTTSHNSLKHGCQGDDSVPPTPAPAPAPAVANMAMNSQALVSTDQDIDDEDGAWTAV
jgi:hypothetical protein